MTSSQKEITFPNMIDYKMLTCMKCEHQWDKKEGLVRCPNCLTSEWNMEKRRYTIDGLVYHRVVKLTSTNMAYKDIAKRLNISSFMIGRMFAPYKIVQGRQDIDHTINAYQLFRIAPDSFNRKTLKQIWENNKKEILKSTKEIIQNMKEEDLSFFNTIVKKTPYLPKVKNKLSIKKRNPSKIQTNVNSDINFDIVNLIDNFNNKYVTKNEVIEIVNSAIKELLIQLSK